MIIFKQYIAHYRVRKVITKHTKLNHIKLLYAIRLVWGPDWLYQNLIVREQVFVGLRIVPDEDQLPSSYSSIDWNALKTLGEK